MSIQLTSQRAVALYDSVTGIAFGPTFQSEEHAQDFMRFCREDWEIPTPRDLRVWTEGELEEAHKTWFSVRVDGETGQLLEEVPA